MRPTLCSFWKFGKILKGIGDQFVKKDTFWRGHTSIKEEKETLELMLEYFIYTRNLHSALLRFSTYRF